MTNQYRLDTEITALCNIRLPFVQSALSAEVATPALISVFADHGGLGVIPAQWQSVEALAEKILQTQALTEHSLAVSVVVDHRAGLSESAAATDRQNALQISQWLAPLQQKVGSASELGEFAPSSWQDHIRCALEHGISTIICSHGLPDAEMMTFLQSQGVTVIATVTHLVEGIVAQEAGCDAVIAQSMEAGGERATFIGEAEAGLYPLTTFVPLLVDELDIPVIAAGDTADVRGAYAVFGMGAQAIQVDSALITTTESGASEAYKNAVLNALECSTELSTAFTARPTRVLINQLSIEGKKIPATLIDRAAHVALLQPLVDTAAKTAQLDWMYLPAGMGAFMAQSVSVGDLLDEWAVALIEPYGEAA